MIFFFGAPINGLKWMELAGKKLISSTKVHQSVQFLNVKIIPRVFCFFPEMDL